VKVVDPKPMLWDAAAALEPVKNDIVVVGAAAVDVALHGRPAAITPTRDVDVVVDKDNVERIVSRLEEAELRPSEIDYEAGFTWVRDDLKVQLIRGFHPFPKGASRGLPQNDVADAARMVAHREEVSFAGDPERARLWVATPACLLALKQRAFGRTRASTDEIVKRDYYDAFLLIAQIPDELLAAYGIANGHVRERVRKAVSVLAADGTEVRLAGEEMVELRDAGNQRDAEAEIRLAAQSFAENL
jgi:hypothetical protein